VELILDIVGRVWVVNEYMCDKWIPVCVWGLRLDTCVLTCKYLNKKFVTLIDNYAASITPCRLRYFAREKQMFTCVVPCLIYWTGGYYIEHAMQHVCRNTTQVNICFAYAICVPYNICNMCLHLSTANMCNICLHVFMFVYICFAYATCVPFVAVYLFFLLSFIFILFKLKLDKCSTHVKLNTNENKFDYLFSFYSN
jgi:hypothetical protein